MAAHPPKPKPKPQTRSATVKAETEIITIDDSSEPDGEDEDDGGASDDAFDESGAVEDGTKIGYWTDAERDKLFKLTAQFKDVFGHIRWPEVLARMEGRNQSSCYWQLYSSKQRQSKAPAKPVSTRGQPTLTASFPLMSVDADQTRNVGIKF